MGSHEPVVLLEGGRLADDQILGDRVELLERFDGVAVGIDDARLDEIERPEMGLDGVPAERVVVP